VVWIFVGAVTKMPEFVKCLEDMEVLDGQEVMLFCVVEGQPMPTVTWFHNDKNIMKNEEYVFTYDRHTGHLYLVILDCLSDDEGEFCCIATNAAGQAVTKCKLRIVPRESTRSVSPAIQPLVINATSVKRDTTSIVSPTVPKIQQQTTAATVTSAAAVNGHLASAESLTLTPPDILFHTKKIPGQSRKVAHYRTVLRRASDNDLLGYRAKSSDQLYRQNAAWKVSDWSVFTKETVKQAEHVPGVRSQTHSQKLSEAKLPLTHGSLQHTIPSTPLTFQTASTESGVPIVPSYSKSPSSKQPSKVSHVKAPVETSQSFTSSRLFEPPRFSLSLSNQTVRDGDAAALRVRFHGNPMPKLLWFFNQKAIEDEEDFIIHSDFVRGESVLWIKEVFPEDDGEFICKAENDYGTAVTHCRLTVHCKCREFYFVCSHVSCRYLYFNSVLTALLLATSPNSAFLLPPLQVVSISGQPRQAYYKFPEPKPQLAGRALLSRDHLCGTVFLLLYRDQR